MAAAGRRLQVPRWIIEPNTIVKRVLDRMPKETETETGVGAIFDIPDAGDLSSNDLDFDSRFALFNRALGGGLTVSSGKRSTGRQAALWSKAVEKYGSPKAARKWVAPPGRSMHERGLAKDIKFASPKIKALAHRIAPEYGLEFPMPWESWHLEPRGARKRR